MKGKCNLCLKEKDLIKRSHIISDFMYRNSGMYDEKHTINSFTLDDFLKGKKPKKDQSGIYDSYIFCADCDNKIINNYEKYACLSIYGEDLKKELCPDCVVYGETNPDLTICSNIDYKKFKLFLLSILFRASISKNKFFDGIKLSKENTEILRTMIYDGKPGNFNDFPFIMATFATSEISPDIFINPIKSIQDGNIKFTFIFAGMSYVFYEGLNIDTKIIEPIIMKTDNELKILHFNNDDAIKYLRSIMGLK